MRRAINVWLVAGLGVDDGKERRNEAWWFAPDGRLATNYLKHFMAPPEREFVSGSEFPVNPIDGVNYGVAICKDMHFASLGRGFGARDAGVMLVPAWDFHHDGWMGANMTKLRGVENGFVVVRSARDGLLSVSDAYRPHAGGCGQRGAAGHLAARECEGRAAPVDISTRASGMSSDGSVPPRVSRCW